MRDAVMDQGTYYGMPQWAMKNGKYVLDENGQRQFIGTAYEPDPVDANDRSKGYINKPESQSGRYYWSVSDLNLDTAYWLVETKAPAGHSLLPQPIEFKLTTARADGSGTTVQLASDLTNQSKWATSAVQAFASDSSTPGPRASWSAAPARPPWSSRTPRLASCPRPAAPESTPTSASQRRSCPGRW